MPPLYYGCPRRAEVRAIAGKIRAATRQRRRQRSRQLLPLLFAAACGFAVLVNRPWAPGPADNSEVLIKGQEPHLLVYRQCQTSFEPLTESAVASRGDLVQIRYVAAGYTYGVILSVDGRGKVTLHFPAAAAEATDLKSAGEVALPYAFELDDAPGYERFYFVVAKAPLAVQDILAKAAALGQQEGAAALQRQLPPKTLVATMTIRKGGHE